MLDHFTKKPQFAGCIFDTSILFFSKIFIQDPSEPNLGHDNPPNANKVISASTVIFFIPV